MSDDMVVRYCAPTLAGIKTGSLFSCPFASDQAVRNEIRRLNDLIGEHGLRVVPLGWKKDRMLIYVYRPDALKSDLSDHEAEKLLNYLGYKSSDPDLCLVQLIRKLNSDAPFPHEIGLFLGYPVEDVIGFMKQGPKKSECTGMWQVYGNKEKAMHCFQQYDICTKIYCNAMAHGADIRKLAVTTTK